MAASIPPIQAHSNVEIEDSCNNCSRCCWPTRERKVKKDNAKFIAEMQIPRDSHEVYDLTLHVTPSPVVERNEASTTSTEVSELKRSTPVPKRDPHKVLGEKK